MASSEPRKPVSLTSRFNRSLNWLLVKLKVEEVPHIKRIIVTVVGGTILIFGVIFLITPFPAMLVIPFGLAILGTEYAWARRWLRKARKLAQQALSKTQEIIGVSGASEEKSAPVKPVVKQPVIEPIARQNKPDSRELAEVCAGGGQDDSLGSR